MKRSSYEELMTFFRDPYRGYLKKEREEDEAGSFPDPGQIVRALDELSEMGYVLFMRQEGSLQGRFLTTALEQCRKSLENKGFLPDLIYCDEDRITERTSVRQLGEDAGLPEDVITRPPDESLRSDPFFKPDFSPDTLDSFFYIGGVFLLKRPGGGGGIQRITGKDCYLLAREILEGFADRKNNYHATHISRVLFHYWGDDEISWANGMRPMEFPEKEAGEITARAVILSKDNPQMLFACLDSIKKHCDIGDRLRYTVIDNGSNENNRQLLLKELEKRGVQYIYYPCDFIYSHLCNKGAEGCTEDFLLFLNDDITVPEGIEHFPSGLLKIASRPHVGAAGMKLLYPEEEGSAYRIQHAGLAQLATGPAHKLAGMDDRILHERGRNKGVWDVMSVTGAALAVETEKFRQVGGFDEKLGISYTDVDLCMDLYDRGLYNVVMNDRFLLHHESATRGRDDMGDDKARRLKKERSVLYGKHPALGAGEDPFYNKNLTRTSPAFEPVWDCPWEDRSVSLPLNTGRAGVAGGGIGRKMRRLMYSVDSIRYVPSMFEDESAVYEVEGWCIMSKGDMAGFEPALEVKTRGERKVFSCIRIPRPDLEQVFGEGRRLCLSGFRCRIEVSETGDMPGKDDVTPLLYRQGFWGRRFYRPMDDEQK